MENFLLVIIVILVLSLIIYSTLKTKKIYDENVEYEPKNQDEMKRIEKRLLLKGYKFKTIKKYEYNYYLNNTREKILLPRIRIYSKRLKKIGLLVNNEDENVKENKNLKKQIIEFLSLKKIDGIIIYNEKTNDFDFIKARKGKSNLVLIFFMMGLFLLVLYVFKKIIL